MRAKCHVTDQTITHVYGGIMRAKCHVTDQTITILFLTVDITITIFIIVLENKITNWSGDYY